MTKTQDHEPVEVTRLVIDRRGLVRLASLLGAAAAVHQLVGCAELDGSQTAAAGGAHGETVAMRDIDVLALTFDGDVAAKTGVLHATAIRDGVAVTMDHFDGHGHTFTITPEHFAELKHGRPVRIRTTMALGHDHIVLVDPKQVVAGSAAVEMPLDEASEDATDGDVDGASDGSVEEEPLQGEVYAALDGGKDPRLYVSGPDDLDAKSVAYCADTADACDADESLWRPMPARKSAKLGRVFQARERLALGDATEQALSIRARRNGGALQRILLRLVRRSGVK